MNIPAYGDPMKFAELPDRSKAFVIACIDNKMDAEKAAERRVKAARRK